MEKAKLWEKLFFFFWTNVAFIQIYRSENFIWQEFTGALHQSEETPANGNLTMTCGYSENGAHAPHLHLYDLKQAG